MFRSLRDFGIDYLVTIGGDDTAFAAATIARHAKGALRVAHVPKTIDNDLPLPTGMPTFGYESARFVGTELVSDDDGGLAHHEPLVSRRRDGAQGGPSGARYR